MQLADRRRKRRLPLQISLKEYAADRCLVGITRDLSIDGVYVHRLPTDDATLDAAAGSESTQQTVEIEFGIPGTEEVIWSKGIVRRQEHSDLFNGSGIELTEMAPSHKKLLDDFLQQQHQHRDTRVSQLSRDGYTADIDDPLC